MNTNPDAKTILCYGDCNVYGFMPYTRGRYPINLRWPGILQNILGNNYNVIEEGLPRRNSGFYDKYYKGTNGLSYLIPCLLSHNPIEWVTILLGTADHRDILNIEPTTTAKNVNKLIIQTKKYAKNVNNQTSNILLIAPMLITHDYKKFSDKYLSGIKKSAQIGSLYKGVSIDTGVYFLDLAKILKPSTKDGMHLTPSGNKKVAEEVSKYIIH